jgi:electron transfer flavoprotein alpha subunit
MRGIMAEQSGILVVGEFEEGKLAAITGELLGGARRLADESGGFVSLLLAGDEAEHAAPQGISLGADRVYAVTHHMFTENSSESCTFLICKVCAEIKPALCLIGQTDMGRDVAPRLAARLESGLSMDCVDVKYDPEQKCFIQTRPAYGGKAMAVMTSAPHRMQVDTVRAKSMEPLDAPYVQKGETIVFSDGLDAFTPRARRTEWKKHATEGLKIEDAKIIVAGGGGVGGPEGFGGILKELADLLGGAVGASRVPVDEGWAPLSMEIGQTGKIVNPDLYIAVGISGASQHVTGCLNSKKIVAINKDPEANIFKISDFGLVADYREALPLLIDKIKSMSQ